MSIELATKFAPYTDDLFKAESKTYLLSNTDFDWTGAHSIKLYKISTTPMNDYARKRVSGGEDSAEALSRYGKLLDLSATTEELLLSHDRSFIFNVDRLDTDETQGQLEAGTALARELREVVVPEVDTNVYKVMTDGAGTKPAAAALTTVDWSSARDHWVGARPVTSDGLPLIGATATPGLHVTGGHGMWGMTLGPLSGKLLAELIVTGRTPRELLPLDPCR